MRPTEVVTLSRRLSLFAALALALGSWFSPPLQAQHGAAPVQLATVPIEHYRFSEVDKDAHFWSALYIASNGKIYAGLCTHADAATSTSSTRRRSRCGCWRISPSWQANGARASAPPARSTCRCEELDGYVYFGEFCEDNGPPVIDAASYQGPHWFRVSLETGRVEQLGKINRYWGLLGQAMDK